jgi:ATP-binding cassette subfamily F protein uup
MRIGRRGGQFLHPGAGRTGPRPSPGNTRKLSYKDQRDYDLLPARIEALEAAIARDEAMLSDHDLYMRDPRLFAALTDGVAAAKAERDAAEHRWLELAEAAEALQA